MFIIAAEVPLDIPFFGGIGSLKVRNMQPCRRILWRTSCSFSGLPQNVISQGMVQMLFFSKGNNPKNTNGVFSQNHLCCKTIVNSCYCRKFGGYKSLKGIKARVCKPYNSMVQEQISLKMFLYKENLPLYCLHEQHQSLFVLLTLAQQ